MTKSKLAIPEDALATHITLLGITGAGKSFASRGMLEWILDQGRRACVIDPIGVHWGIRLAKDGREPSGYPVVILGGDHQDLELAPGSGAKVGRWIAGAQVSAVVDVSLMGIGERQRFFTDFANALMRANRKPLHVVVDECHEFMPQSGYGEKSVDRGKMINAGNRLVSGGRARGLRVMLLSQRPAKVHKDSLTQVQTMVAMRSIASHDRKAIGAWIQGLRRRGRVAQDRKEPAAARNRRGLGVGAGPGVPRADPLPADPDL